MNKTTLKRAIVAIFYALYGCFDNDGWAKGGWSNGTIVNGNGLNNYKN